MSPPNALRGELPVLAHYKDKVRAAFIALFQDDKLFLVKGKFSGCWQLPGGSVDQSDLNVWEGATREFYEETGCVAPLPPVDLLGWFETTIDFGSGPFAGVVLVLKAKSAAEIPWAPADETSECAVVKWGVELEGLTYRWPNDQTIPLIYDKSNSEGGSRPAVKRGPWSACRPVLRAGGGQKEVAA